MPSLKRLEDFDRSWLKDGITNRQFEELSSLSFIGRNANVVLMGPSGLGKTHLMLALGQKACMEGFTTYYTTCIDLVEYMIKARENNRLKRKLVRMRKPHLLLVDEVGYETLSPERANLFFQVVNAIYEQGSMIITTNKPFGKWAEIMSDDAVASAT